MTDSPSACTIFEIPSLITSLHESEPIDSVTASLLVDDGCFNREVNEHGTSDAGPSFHALVNTKRFPTASLTQGENDGVLQFQSPLAFFDAFFLV